MAATLIFSSRGTVRDALWLWAWLLSHTKLVNVEWQPVADGFAITDEQIAWNLDVSADTVRRWRRRLERLGFIRTELVRPRHRRFWLVKPGGPEKALLEAPVEGPVN
jgi:predicted DNA-binding transcriptional regulator